MGISKRYGLAALAVMAATAAILLAMGRVPICTCGYVALWWGSVQSEGNSQHLIDWYSFSHIIHGFLFAALLGWLMPRRPVGLRLVIAAMIEAGWELLENSPIIINRYREATMAYGYTGDSVINSMSDITMMLLGFLFAQRFGWKYWVPIAIAFELFTLWAIRDNLALNLLMLISPIDAVRAWQMGA